VNLMKFSRSTTPARFIRNVRTNWFEQRFLIYSVDKFGPNKNMFKQDLENAFLMGGQRSEKNFDIFTNDHELTNRLLANIRNRRSARSTHDNIRNLLSDVAGELATTGRSFYYLHDSNDRNEKTYLTPYSSATIFRVFGKYLQYIPRSTNSSSDPTTIGPREIRLLDSKKALYFQWPKEIRRQISKQAKALSALDRYGSSSVLDFLPNATDDNPNPHSNFNFSEWRTAHDLELYRATSITGWGARKSHDEKASDFFILLRQLRFKKFNTKLRDDILRQLSRELTKVGGNYFHNFRVSIQANEKMPSVAEIEKLEKRLLCEEADFPEVFEYLRS